VRSGIAQDGHKGLLLLLTMHLAKALCFLPQQVALAVDQLSVLYRVAVDC
jgi:hypothetical protein